jgi:hypothetical protein
MSVQEKIERYKRYGNLKLKRVVDIYLSELVRPSAMTKVYHYTYIDYIAAYSILVRRGVLL